MSDDWFRDIFPALWRALSTNYRWGTISITLAVMPIVLMPLAFSLRLDGVGGFVPLFALAGLTFGLLGMWERGTAKKLAFWGVLLNIFMPPVSYGLYFLAAMGAMARGMGP